MSGKEFRRAAVAGQIPRSRLGAVLAKLGGIGFRGLAPGATDAHEAAWLVLPKQLFTELDGAGFFPENDGAEALQRSPAANSTIVVVNFLARGDRSVLIV